MRNDYLYYHKKFKEIFFKSEKLFSECIKMLVLIEFYIVLYCTEYNIDTDLLKISSLNKDKHLLIFFDHIHREKNAIESIVFLSKACLSLI